MHGASVPDVRAPGGWLPVVLTAVPGASAAEQAAS
jgi:hypothetical protein